MSEHNLNHDEQVMEAELECCEHVWSWHFGPLIERCVEVGQCMICGHLRAALFERRPSRLLVMALRAWMRSRSIR